MQHGTILDLRLANGPLNINIEKRVSVPFHADASHLCLC
jgi:hypothetical protein